MKLAIDGRTLELPDGVIVTLTIAFPGGQGISVHPESAPPTTMAAAARQLVETGGRIIPGGRRARMRPGIGRKECPLCHEICGATLKNCPNQFCTHVFTGGTER